MAEVRREADSLGQVLIPSDAYYGAQTARAMENFPISGDTIGQLPNLVKALALVKAAAARANATSGRLDAAKASAIELACTDIASGAFDTAFQIDVFQGGAGTSTNMNINEVIANRALERMGLAFGRYDMLHPNDDVNMSQSTNDVYPTAIRLAMLMTGIGLRQSLSDLSLAFRQKGAAFLAIPKLGRTQLQDAVPMTLGQEFHAFASTLGHDLEQLTQVSQLLLQINLGGTAIGTSINADHAYRQQVIAELSRISGYDFAPAKDLVGASWDTGAFVLLSGMLKCLATKLSKIANDLRLLSSGPRGGLAEIRLPAMQPGSSIMPGKINPVIPEVVNQVAFHVIGMDLTVTLAAEAGQLQLNAMEPVIAAGILGSMRLLTNVMDVMREKCVAGIKANEIQCKSHLEAGTALATLLVPVLGYENAARVAKDALETKRRLEDVVSELPENVRMPALKKMAECLAH